MPLTWKLTSYQGHVARKGEVAVDLAAGSKHKVTLIERLEPGIYDLDVTAPGKVDLKAVIQVLPSKDYFGEDASELLTNAHLLRRMLGLTTEHLYLDWDNTEPAPNLRHFHWFEEDIKKRREILQLPRNLVPLAERKTSTAAAVVKAQQDDQVNQQKVTALQNQIKQQKDAVAAVEKRHAQVQMEYEVLQKALAAAKGKEFDVKQTETMAQEKIADARMAWQDAMEKAKVSKAGLPKAEKAQRDTDMLNKDGAAKAKAAMDASILADKQVDLADKALKAAEKEGIAAKIEGAKTKRKQAMAAAETAKKLWTDARRRRKTSQGMDRRQNRLGVPPGPG